MCGLAATVDRTGVGDEASQALADGVTLAEHLDPSLVPLLLTWPLTMQFVFSPQGEGLHGLPGFCRFLLYLADLTAYVSAVHCVSIRLCPWLAGVKIVRMNHNW